MVVLYNNDISTYCSSFFEGERINMKRQVFFSFRYAYDSWRAGQIRSMGKVSSSSTFSDNDWESIKEETDSKVEKLIDDQLEMRSCLVLLIGQYTYNRKWIEKEIYKAWKAGKGIVAIHIHGLKNAAGEQCDKGKNPLECFCIDKTFNYIVKNGSPADKNEINLAEVVKTYDPPYKTSKYVYEYIEENIADWIEEAIELRNKYPK